MKKKEDMMKHCFAEKTGLKIESKKIIFFIIFFLLYIEIFPQIPINGFCRYSSIKTDSSYSSILFFKFKTDSISDLLLTSPEKRKAIFLRGSLKNNFTSKDTLDFKFPISKIKLLNSKIDTVKDFIFISRKNRNAGILKLSCTKKYFITSDFEFKSFPENIDIGDINLNGKNEALISGSAFDGLSILFFDGKKIREQKVDEKTNYTNAVFIDLNNDSLLDIAAFNLLSNSLIFFYNEGNSTFRKAREIFLKERVNFLKCIDLNRDGYDDLLFVKNEQSHALRHNSIEIFYGDFQSSYDKTLEIKTNYNPDKFILNDFNQDGNIDIAYTNLEKQTLSVIFAKDINLFYPEITILRKDGIKDIAVYQNKFNRGISGLSKNGEIFFITKVPSFFGNYKIAFSAKASQVSYYDFPENKMNGIFFLDEFNNSFNFLASKNSNFPNLFYSFALSQTQSEFKILDNSNFVKTFFCYSFDNRLIEVISYDFLKNKIDKNLIYADGKIKELKISNAKNGTVNVYVLYQRKEKLGVEIFNYSENKYSLKNKVEFESQAISPNFVFNKSKAVFFWQKEPSNKNQNKVELYEKFFDKKIDSTALKFSLSLVDSFRIISVGGKFFNSDREDFIGFIISGSFAGKNKILYVKNNFVWQLHENDSSSLNLLNKSQLFINRHGLAGLEKIFLYDPANYSINKIDFIKKGKNISMQKIPIYSDISLSDLNRYFIMNYSSKNYLLLFTKKNESYITVKNLSLSSETGND